MKTSNVVYTKLLMTALLLPLFACNDGTGSNGTLSDIAVSFSTQAPVGAAAQAASDTIQLGVNTIVIDAAQMVLREVELRRLDVGDCDTDTSGACQEFELGPVLVSLPTDASVAGTFSIQIPAGTYTDIEFDIHKTSPDETGILTQHPEFLDKSIRISGTFNGTPFLFESDLDVEQELRLLPALVIDANVPSTNITIRVNLAGWFSDGAGGLLDPATGNKGGVNENIITDNIKQTFEAFEDENRDGS